jgi:hypothetical protein
MNETRKIRFEGNREVASALVQFLREEDVRVDVDWEPHDESRGLEADITQVLLDIAATGAVAAMKLAVKRFRQAFPGAQAEIQEEDTQNLAATRHSKGVVPDESPAQVHAVRHGPSGDETLCGASPIALLPGRFDPAVANACPACVSAA